ncbi:histidine kinase [Flavobacteriaceae bacterium UJ101]|nr:histidine kinase [Flavobacteriaceae bacterium UJ101]
MKKKTLLVLISVMTSALLGIMLLQIIWLSEGIDESEGAFSNKVHLVLGETSKKIREKEQQVLYNEIDNLDTQVKKIPKKQSFSFVKEDPVNNHFYVYKQEVLIEESIIPLGQTVGGVQDSLSIINEYSAQLKTELPKISENQTPKSLSPADYDILTGNNLTIDRYVKLKGAATDIEDRISISIIDSVLTKELKDYNIDAEYEFAVLRKDSTLTKVTTKDFEIDDKTYYSSLFFGVNDETEFILSIHFPKRDRVVKGPIFGQFILAALLMSIVVSVFGVSLYYMRKQRKISEIKTDFVNNMTHEFKTPIATINVAVDALKSPQILDDENKIKHYANLIKQENKRLNSHVEMVLRMSRLEKNQIDLNIQKTNLNTIVKNAVDHIRLIVEDRNGTIFEKYTNDQLMIKADAFHLGNVILNVLDNANKYSPESPKISVEVFKENDYACIQVEDQGMGMSKSVQKKIFEQFYREETGNIHNIKGHGLGLAYLKKIVDLHKGVIEVQSEKGKGSKFVIKIPL